MPPNVPSKSNSLDGGRIIYLCVLLLGSSLNDLQNLVKDSHHFSLPPIFNHHPVVPLSCGRTKKNFHAARKWLEFGIFPHPLCLGEVYTTNVLKWMHHDPTRLRIIIFNVHISILDDKEYFLQSRLIQISFIKKSKNINSKITDDWRTFGVFSQHMPFKAFKLKMGHSKKGTRGGHGRSLMCTKRKRVWIQQEIVGTFKME